jgi:hypothetical protein
MSYLLVPHAVTDRSADVWFAAIDEPPGRLVVTWTAGTRELRPADWQDWTVGGRVIRHGRIPLPALEPRTPYALQLRAGDSVVARGSITTLPSRLPSVGEKPFTVLLGSCFCRKKDDAGDVGRTVFHLPTGAAPEIKILCGDQVYLDSPWYSFARPHTLATLQSLFVENYAATWTQEGGFRDLLAEGANYFMSDDHEFWNNAPTPGSYAVDTWLGPLGHHDDWWRAATDLIAAFQSPATTDQIAVPPLSIFLSDTRRNRDRDRDQLITQDDLDALRDWVRKLTAPGMLVVGQPIFDVQHGAKGHFVDWGLADYRQYRELVSILTAARYSIVVLTGDVHYGRVAHCPLRSGAQLVEVISSPLMLVDKSAGGSWSAAPDTFPAFDVPGVVKSRVTTERGFQAFHNHFLTLELAGRGPTAIDLSVKYWPIASGGATTHSTTVFEQTLH